MYYNSGVIRQVPPIDSRFQLDRVLLRTDTVPPEIHILFRWARDPRLFGVRAPVMQNDDEPPIGMTDAENFASMITISLEENLLAIGYAWRTRSGNSGTT